MTRPGSPITRDVGDPQEPGRPDRRAAHQPGRDLGHQQDPLPGVSAQRATARGVPGQRHPGRQLLAGWLSWASHSRIPEFVALARSIRRYRDLIRNTLDHGLSNARSESTIRLNKQVKRVGCGFRNHTNSARRIRFHTPQTAGRNSDFTLTARRKSKIRQTPVRRRETNRIVKGQSRDCIPAERVNLQSSA